MGCYVSNYYLGALCYADDLTLLAPTAAVMRTLLTICEEFASEYAMTFNADKSKNVLFSSHAQWHRMIARLFSLLAS